MEPTTVADAADTRIRVATLIDHLGRHGGAESLALSIVTRLDPARFDVTLVVSRWPPPPDAPSPEPVLEELRAAGVRFLPLGRQRGRDVQVWGKLVRFLRRERIDVLHAHKFGSNVWGTVVGRAAGTPVVLAHEHSWSYEGQPVRRFLDGWLIGRGATRFIAVSREDQRLMTEVEGVPAERTLFVPNGISPGPPATGAVTRAQLGIADDALLVGAVGTLRPVKDFALLVRAAALLAPKLPGLRVVLVGEGPQRPELETLIEQLGAGETVRLLGHRSDVRELLPLLDVAVCCSRREGSPLSVMEYMEAGLPVVGTRVGGIPDLVEPGVNGLLVPPRDPQALADALGELLGDLPRARAMGEKGRQRRREEFDLDVLVGRLEALYEQLVRERRSRKATGRRA